MRVKIDEMGYGTFFIDMVSNLDKSTCKGRFKVLCILNPFDYVKADSLYRELLGGTNPHLASDVINTMCYAMAQLKYRIVEAPSWWHKDSQVGGGSVGDNILLEVLNLAIESEQQYRDWLDKKYDEAKVDIRNAIDKGELKRSEEKSEEDKQFDKDEIE